MKGTDIQFRRMFRVSCLVNCPNPCCSLVMKAIYTEAKIMHTWGERDLSPRVASSRSPCAARSLSPRAARSLSKLCGSRPRAALQGKPLDIRWIFIASVPGHSLPTAGCCGVARPSQVGVPRANKPRCKPHTSRSSRRQTNQYRHSRSAQGTRINET
jgi:hypothetical protein